MAEQKRRVKGEEEAAARRGAPGYPGPGGGYLPHGYEGTVVVREKCKRGGRER